MDQVHVDAVGAEAAQARVARAPQIGGAEVFAFGRPRLLVEAVADLGDDHHVVAPPGQRPAEHALVASAVLGKCDALDGASDGLVSAPYVRAYSDAIAGSRIVTIERAGHSPANEQPAKFVETVLGFMGE